MQITAETGVRATFCRQCGSQVFMVNVLYRQRMKDHGSFYCINGHENQFVDGDSQMTLAEVELEKVPELDELVIEELPDGAEGFCDLCGKPFKRLKAHFARSHKDHWRMLKREEAREHKARTAKWRRARAKGRARRARVAAASKNGTSNGKRKGRKVTR